MHTTLITGINGFVGQHLAREMHTHGYNVIGTGQAEQIDPSLKPVVKNYIPADLTNPSAIDKLPLEQSDCIINLAGLASVSESFDKPEVYKAVNVSIIKNLGEAVKKYRKDCRLIAISTGAVYDTTFAPPFRETSAIWDKSVHNPYIVSKLLMEEAVLALKNAGVDCVIVRPFNHLGPGQQKGFLVPDLANQIMAAKQTGEGMQVGDLSTKRDFTDVRDVVRAYRLLASVPELHHSIYNVCSGRSVQVKEILGALAKDLSPNRPISTKVDPHKLRPHDPKDLYGDYSRLKDDTEWMPQIPLDQTITDFVDWFTPR